MGVPKRRVSKARKGDRRSHHALSAPPLVECPHCHEKKQSHHACPNCGYYGGREAIRIRVKAPKESSPS